MAGHRAVHAQRFSLTQQLACHFDPARDLIDQCMRTQSDAWRLAISQAYEWWNAYVHEFNANKGKQGLRLTHSGDNCTRQGHETSHSGAHAFDGRLSTWWQTCLGEVGGWVHFNLAAPDIVTQLANLYGGSQGSTLKAFHVQYLAFHVQLMLTALASGLVGIISICLSRMSPTEETPSMKRCGGLWRRPATQRRCSLPRLPRSSKVLAVLLFFTGCVAQPPPSSPPSPPPRDSRRELLIHSHTPHTHTPHTTLMPPSAPPPPPSPMRPPVPPAFSYEYNGENSSDTGGCQSTWIRSDSPDYNGGQDTVVSWDGSSTTGHFDSALVQFTNIIGSGPNQLRPHEYIQRATLRYNVDETFLATARGATAQLHEISKEWSANSTTFRTFTSAQGLNEDEYRTPAIATAFANPRAGWYEIDVTASVRSWVNGVNNNGWIWMPSPQSLGGSADGAQMRSCSAPPDRRVNLVVFAALQPPRPPSPPARPPPPPSRPPPPPSPPHAPFTVLQIRNAQHARLRMVAPDANYVNDVGVLWDGNSACAPAAHQTRSPRGRLSYISCCSQRPLPDVPLLC